MDHIPGATDRDSSRPTATDLDNEYALSLEEVSLRYAKAGHPRTIRSLQRYCTVGHLDCRKVATTLGDKYLVTPQSVSRHIAQIEELRSLDIIATERDQSRPVATTVAPQQSQLASAPKQLTGPDAQRQSTTTDTDISRYVAGLEREVERALEDRDFLRDQLKTKDQQIESLLERDRETNVLVRTLQQMLSPLLGSARREPPEEGSRPQF